MDLCVVAALITSLLFFSREDGSSKLLVAFGYHLTPPGSSINSCSESLIQDIRCRCTSTIRPSQYNENHVEVRGQDENVEKLPMLIYVRLHEEQREPSRGNVLLKSLNDISGLCSHCSRCVCVVKYLVNSTPQISKAVGLHTFLQKSSFALSRTL